MRRSRSASPPNRSKVWYPTWESLSLDDMRRNGDLPTVIISEPGSPEFVGRTLDNQDADCRRYEEDETGSFDGAMNHDFDSSLSLNQQIGATVGVVVKGSLDGGYGWVIVFAAFCSNMIVDGVCTCFTEFKSSYAEYFGSSDAVTAMIGSMLIGTYLLVGPIVGGLVNKFGSRLIVCVGALISGFAFLLSVASPDITVFLILYSVIGGIGFGMIYLPAIVVVGYYFEEKRAIATGIAVAGSGFGTIVFPLLAEYTIQTLGWKNAVWILAGCVFCCALLGLLYKPPPSMTDAVQLENGKDMEMVPLRNGEDGADFAGNRLSGSRMDTDNPLDDPAMARLKNALSGCDDNDSTPSSPVRPSLSPVLEGTASKSRAGSSNQSNGASNVRQRKLTITSMSSDMTSTNDLKASSSNLNTGSALNRISARNFAQSLSRLSQRGDDKSTLSIAMSGVDPQEFTRPLNRQDIFYGGSIRNLNEFKNEGSNMQQYRGSVLSIPRSVIGQSASRATSRADLNDLGSKMGGSRVSHITGGFEAEDEVIEYDDSKCKWIPAPIRNAFSEMIDINLLKDPTMMLLCISNLLGMMGFYIPFVFFKDLAHSHGVSPSLSRYLVPVIGVTNTVGRIFFGWLADRHIFSALAINNFSLIACGLLTLICPLLSTFVLQLVYASLFGFIISAYICLTSIVLADLLGLEKLTNSFGLLVVSRGVASLAGSPFAGLVYDFTQSYSACFYFAGIVIVVAGLISCAIPYAARWAQQNEVQQEEDNKELDNVSGKLSVLTERSEENLTEYQRTIQSLRQQYALLEEVENERKRIGDGNGIEETVNEEEEEYTYDEPPEPEVQPVSSETSNGVKSESPAPETVVLTNGDHPAMNGDATPHEETAAKEEEPKKVEDATTN